MKYKKGDKAKIRSRQWYDDHKGDDGIIWNVVSNSFVPGMAKLCGKIATIIEVHNTYYYIDIDNEFYCWTDGMFEDNNIMEKTLNITIPEGKKPKMTENENGCVIKWIEEEKTFEEYVQLYKKNVFSRHNLILIVGPLSWDKEFKYGLLQYIADDLNEEKLDWSNNLQSKYEVFCHPTTDEVEFNSHTIIRSQAAIFTLVAAQKAIKLIPKEFLKTF